MEDRDDYPPTVTYAQYVEMEKELASLKEVVKELIPIAEERLRRIVNYDMPDYHKVRGSIRSIIDRAKRISDNK